MITVLRYGVILSFVLSLAGVTFLVIQTLSLGKKRLHSTPRGDWKRGIVYAFGKGMMPWEKESAQKHFWTYLAGFVYHFGIFATFVYMLHSIFSLPLSGPLIIILRIFMACGLLCGLALFAKRSIVAHMRQISCMDDYIANALVDLFMLLSLLDTFFPAIRPILYAQSILLLIYIPVGKIRHCFFFFYSRVLFGYFFGRRGVLPQGQKPLEPHQ
jgi:hypothetical protein